MALGLFMVFIPRTGQLEDSHWPQLANSLYLSYGKFSFVFSLSLIILPSLLGFKTFITFMLDTKFFSWIAKVTFWGYLIHLTIMSQFFGNITADFYFDFAPMYPLFVSHTVSSLTLGFVFSLLIEIPCSKLQRTLIKGLMKKK